MIPSDQNYGYAPDIEFFGSQTGVIRRLEGHYPNKMAISRLLASGRLTNHGRRGALAFKRADLDVLIAEKRCEVVSSVMAKGPSERERIIAELAEGNAAIHFRATPLKADRAKAEQQVATMVATHGTGRRGLSARMDMRVRGFTKAKRDE